MCGDRLDTSLQGSCFPRQSLSVSPAAPVPCTVLCRANSFFLWGRFARNNYFHVDAGLAWKLRHGTFQMLSSRRLPTPAPWGAGTGWNRCEQQPPPFPAHPV